MMFVTGSILVHGMVMHQTIMDPQILVMEPMGSMDPRLRTTVLESEVD